MSTDPCYDDLKAIREKYGTSRFDAAVRKLMRERVNSGRDKRVKSSPAEKQRLFDRQQGICPECNERLFIPARRNETDHIDPNRADFNDIKNKHLVHPNCNRKKGAKSIGQRAKESGRTYAELVHVPDEPEI